MKYSLCIGAYPGKDVFYHLEKVREHNLDGLEYYMWWDLNLEKVALAQELIGAGISTVCTRFISLVDETLRESYIKGLKETIETCRLLGVRSIISQTGNCRQDIPREIQRATMIETLKMCAHLCEQAGVVLEIEPLNGLVDHIGYFLQRSDEAVDIIDKVASPNVKLCFDVYHQQITEGNVTHNATAYVNRISHYHIADNPGRQEPGTGELNYVNILKAIKATGFNNYVGIECNFSRFPDLVIEELQRDVLP